MGQSELGAYTDDEEAERPARAEAAAVAGDGPTTGAASNKRFEAVEEQVELAVVQVDYTVEGSGDDEYPVVHVFGRTPDLELVHVRVLEFRPYFYAPADNLTEGRLAEYPRITGYEDTDDDGEPYQSIRGTHLWKIFGQTPRDVGRIRDEFDHYEADILFPNRFLIDKDVTGGIRVPRRETAHGDDDTLTLRVHHEEVQPVDLSAEPRVNTFDIEVDDRSGFPEDGEETIICIASHDSYDDEYVLWLYDPPEGADPPSKLDEYDPILSDEEDDEALADLDVDIRSFETEEAMLAAFLDYIDETDPDVLTGWNFTDFDAPYLLDRLDVLDGDTEHDLDANRLSRVDEVWRSDWQGPDIKGRIAFDLLYAYQRTKFTELDSYRLEDVGQRELGIGKERYAGDIGDLWEQNPKRLLEYNLRDVELCVELDDEQDIIAFWNEVRQFVGCKLEDATTPGDAVDMYVLHKLHDTFALPSKGKQEGEEYEGGAVFDPITGVRENVSVLDLKCFSGDTELLTPDGVANIQDVEVGDPVYTLNPETFECEVKPVEETHEYENKFGELHHLSGNTHDFKVTENHRFLTSSERGWDEQTPADFEFCEYREIPDEERFAFPQHEPVGGRSPDTFQFIDEVKEGHVVVYTDDDLRRFRNRMPEAVTETLTLVHGSSAAMSIQQKVGKYLIPLSVYREHRGVIEQHADDLFLKYDRGHREVPTAFEMDDWLELLGWFVTEGSTDSKHGRLTLHQNDEDGRDAIRALLDRLKLNYSTDERGFNLSNRYLTDWLETHCGAGYADKRLPEWVFELDAPLSKTLLDTMIRGDGSRAESGLGKFWTKSDRLKDDVARLAVRCGQKPTVTKQADGTWYISIGKRGSFKKATNATVEDHDGTVHCITAEDNHVVLAGRNGHFQWVGQSLYPMCMVTINASPETKVDPEEYDGDTYRAPNGTRFRKEPDGVIREMVDELLTEREEKKSLRDDHDPKEQAYLQYDRQQQAVKVIMNCFTPDTEVLTPDGVRGIRELSVGDEVCSLDPESMEMETKPVVETHEYPEYEGELVDIETSKIDFSVTPNHRMLVRKNETNGITEDDYSFVEAGNLDRATNYELPHDWEGPDGDALQTVDLTEWVEEYELWVRPDVHGHTFAGELGYYPDTVLKNDIGKEGYIFDPSSFEEHRSYIESVAEQTYIHEESGRKWVPQIYDGDDFLDLLAWYITEGNVYTSESNMFGDDYRGSATTVKIAQNAVSDGGTTAGEAPTDHESIGSLLDRMGFDYHVDDRCYQFTSRLLGTLLEDLCGEDSFEKQIPEFVFGLSTEQKERFLETLVAGDGDRQPGSWRYTTSSTQLRDDVLRLCAHLGLTASYNKDSGSWRIYVTEDAKNTLRMHRSGSRSTAENGVYCVTVEDNHTLLAGRNGKFQFVGQSLYGVLGWNRFRLYDREMGAAVTATGRDVIEFTEEVTTEMGKTVTYGDTDSVMISLGDSLSTEEAIDRSFELEERINDAYDEFAREELNATEHRFQIEFEKLYRRFFQAGKKKRYAGHIVWKEGKEVDDIDITGFEYKRSDIAPITKEVQREVIEMIVMGEDRDEIKEYVHEVIEQFQSGEIDPEQIGIPGGIGKRLDNYDTDTAQVRGAKYANLLLGTNFQRGSKPKRLYLDRVHSDFFERIEDEEGLDPAADPLYGEFRRNPDVICFEYADQVPDEFEIDWEKMLDKTLKGPIARILEALDISWDEVKAGQEQTGLGEYM
jgi:DNA polymerase I